jgi:HEAT repeat protein
MKPSMARFNTAEQLAQLTRRAPSDSVSDVTVDDLISLLDDSDDVVRLWAAAALGNLKAKGAIPKLTALLPTADCIEGPVTSARSIRFALERMGVKPPRAPSYEDCHRQK